MPSRLQRKEGTALKFHRIFRSADGQDTARAWDWLTALSPMLLMMVVNYRWSAVLAVLTASSGYLAVAAMWQWLSLLPLHLAPALLCGVLVACCLPASLPLWLPAAAGVVGGVVVGLPAVVNRFVKRNVLSCPVYFPALSGFLAVRYAFAAHFIGFSLPVMWARTDAVASATPLASLGTPATQESVRHLFWGFDAGSMGGGPVPALLLGFAYLLLRRRLHPIPVSAMVATVALLSLLFWGDPLYAVLGGGTLLAAMLVGDESFVHVGWKGRLVGGVTAGVVTVLCRLWWRMDGAAVGLLAAGVLTPVLHVVYHAVAPHAVRFVAYLRQKFAKTEN